MWQHQFSQDEVATRKISIRGHFPFNASGIPFLDKIGSLEMYMQEVFHTNVFICNLDIFCGGYYAYALCHLEVLTKTSNL